MIYIIVFVVMCILDWKLDTYMVLKVLGTPFIGLILFMASLFFYENQKIELPSYTETFINGNYTSDSRLGKSDETNFVYSTESGTKEINSDNISEVVKSYKNTVTAYKYTYPKSAKILFFLPDETTYKIEIKEE